MTTPKTARSPLHQAYPVRTVARLTGLTPDLIRAWERRYGVVRPIRGPRGARLYNSDDVAHLRLLASLVARGRAIGDIARLDRATLRSLAAAAVPDQGDEESGRSDGHIIDRILAAVARFDSTHAETLLGEALLAMGSSDFVRRIGIPLLAEVGERWSRGVLSVAEEHLISAMLRSLLSSLAQLRGGRSDPAVLLATPSGERHELGLSLVGLLLLDAGLSIAHLGADLPADEILNAAARSGVGVVGLSLVHAENEHAVREVGKVAAQLAAETELWLGGAQAREVARALPAGRALVLQDLAEVEAHVRRVAAARALPG